jgi:hypothetical protein
LGRARLALRENRYQEARRWYAAAGRPPAADVAFEQGTLLLRAAELDAAMGALAVMLQDSLQSAWSRSQDRGDLHGSGVSVLRVLAAAQRQDRSRGLAPDLPRELNRLPGWFAREAGLCRAWTRAGRGADAIDQDMSALLGRPADLHAALFACAGLAVQAACQPLAGRDLAGEIRTVADAAQRNRCWLLLARHQAQRGDYSEADAALAHFAPAAPLIEERLPPTAQNQGAALTRPYFDLSWLQVRSRIQAGLAVPYLRAAGALADARGPRARAMLGRALQLSGDLAAADTVLVSCAAPAGELGLGPDLADYLRGLAAVRRGEVLYRLGRQDEAAALWAQTIGPTNGVYAVALSAERARLRRSFGVAVAGPASAAVADQLEATSFRGLNGGLEEAAYRDAGVALAAALAGQGTQENTRVTRLLEAMQQEFNPGGGERYSPLATDPRLLTALATCYFLEGKTNWSLSKEVVGGLGAVYPDYVCVLEVYGYLMASVSDPGHSAPANG